MGQPAYDMSSEVRRRKAPQTQRKVALRVEKAATPSQPSRRPCSTHFN